MLKLSTSWVVPSLRIVRIVGAMVAFHTGSFVIIFAFGTIAEVQICGVKHFGTFRRCKDDAVNALRAHLPLTQSRKNYGRNVNIRLAVFQTI